MRIDYYSKNLWVISMLCCVPCLVDGLIQTFTDYESTNLRRVIFGIVAGIGIGFWAAALDSYLKINIFF